MNYPNGILEPIHSNAKSFYKKAHCTLTPDGVITLTSYETKVATYNTNTDEAEVFGWYSTTTARHINEFLQQCGKAPMNKTQINNNSKQ